MSKYHLKCTEPGPGPPKKIRKPVPPEPLSDQTGLIAVINPDTPCCCEVVSRALKSDLPRYLGMSNRRGALQLGPDELLDCNPDIKFDASNVGSQSKPSTRNSKDCGKCVGGCSKIKKQDAPNSSIPTAPSKQPRKGKCCSKGKSS